MGGFGKSGDRSSGELELRVWKMRSVTCLQQFTKMLFPMIVSSLAHTTRG